MRSCVIALALVLGAGATASAQQTASVGAKAGVNFATLKFEGEEEADDAFDNKTGLIGGLFVVVPANSRFGLQSEVLFSQLGAKAEEGGVESRIKLNFLDVPILARASTAPTANGASFHVFAGPSLGFRLSAEAENSFEDEEETEDLDDEVKRFNLGLVVGAGVEFGRFVVDGRYTWGLTDLNKEEDEGISVKNRVFSVMAGFRF